MNISNSHDGPAPASPTPIVVSSDRPVRIILEQGPTRGLARFGRWLLFTVLALSLLMNFETIAKQQSLDGDEDVREKYHSLSKDAEDKVAIIEVEGTIMHSDGFIKKQIDRARKDKKVKAIVLRVDSPGGTVTGSDYIYHHLKEMLAERKIPMVVSMGGIAASGGYYVSMAAGDAEHSIYAEPTTWTGSIGVIIPHYDLSKLLEKWDVADDSISSHPLKQMGSLTHQVSKEELEKEREILKGLVDDSFARFKEIVLASRPALRGNPEWQSEVFTGRIFAADQAKEHGLVDDLGYLEDAIEQAVTQAGLDKSKTRVVKYVKNGGIFDQLMLGSESKSPLGKSALTAATALQGQAAPGGDARQAAMLGELTAILNMATPRPFYICSWLPGLATLPGF